MSLLDGGLKEPMFIAEVQKVHTYEDEEGKLTIIILYQQ